MEDIKGLYILVEPINTPIGDIHFLKVGEYTKLLKYIPYLQLKKFEILNFFLKHEDESVRKLGELISEMSFLDIIHETKVFLELYQMFSELFELCFKKDVFDLIKDDEEFEKYKTMIMDMNCIEVEEKNPNPEIERFNQYKKIYNANKNGGITFEAIYTSVWKEFHVNPKELTLYEFYALFNRIIQFKNYEATLLYSSVTNEVKVQNWYNHVDIFKKEEKTTLEDFSNNAQSILQ